MASRIFNEDIIPSWGEAWTIINKCSQRKAQKGARLFSKTGLSFHNILCEYISSLDFFMLTTRFLYDIDCKGCQRAEIR